MSEPTPSVPGPEPFQRVSPRLVPARLVRLALTALPILAAIVVAGVLLDLPGWLVLTVTGIWLVATLWYGVVAVRQVPALGYQCREDDLLIVRGIMLRRSTLVPYGRMQFVEVSHGPILRQFGLATVELHTAAALSEASVEGLPRAEAEALRDALATRGESNLAGL